MVQAESSDPYPKNQIAKALEFSRSSLYYESKLEPKDKAMANQILELHDTDDTLGHKKIGYLLKTSKNRAKRVMRKYDICPRRKKKKYRYPGKSSTVFDNLNRTEELIEPEGIIFSDIFEFRLADGSKVYGCFALLKRTRQILSLMFDYHMRSDLVTSTIERIDFLPTNPIWHSDQGRQYGAKTTIDLLLENGFRQSMSRAGTPTDNPFAERFVGIFKLAVVERQRDQVIGGFLYRAENWINFYNNERPHEGIGNISPNEYARVNHLKTVPYITLI
jgi:putative transposase